ncbi:MAG TPA: RNA polymerase sigma factor [Candidatus Omnitrophota bacterium]|nr:RNA polymerase sigma factor [Candidatus Omnitrophota bacterium]
MQEVEKGLIERAAQGDMGAFREIYQRTSGFVYSIAYRIVNRKAEADEVTQDVFLKVHHHLKTFKFESSFKTWLYRVTVNTALNMAKKTGRISWREVEFEEPEAPREGAQEAAVRNIETREAEEQLHQLLAQLNPDQRACIILREIEGLDYQNIAQTLGIHLNTVRSRLKRAREALMALGKKEVASHGM